MYVPCLKNMYNRTFERSDCLCGASVTNKKKFYDIDTCSPSAFITPEMEEKSVKIGGLYY